MSEDFYQKSLQIYDQLVEQFPNIQRKGKKNPYTSVNGHMFSFLDPAGMISIRLSPEDQEAFMAKHNATHSIQYGKTMRGYVLVPSELHEDHELLVKTLTSSYEYVSSLKPKPTKGK